VRNRCAPFSQMKFIFYFFILALTQFNCLEAADFRDEYTRFLIRNPTFQKYCSHLLEAISDAEDRGGFSQLKADFSSKGRGYGIVAIPSLDLQRGLDLYRKIEKKMRAINKRMNEHHENETDGTDYPSIGTYWYPGEISKGLERIIAVGEKLALLTPAPRAYQWVLNDILFLIPNGERDIEEAWHYDGSEHNRRALITITGPTT
jgi:hypothetical protein